MDNCFRYFPMGLGLIFLVSSSPAQGPLSPGGPPGPSMKSLAEIHSAVQEVESRFPLKSGSPGVTIDATTGTISVSQSGSYFLTDSLVVTSGGSSLPDGNGITVNANDVTIDLNGFAIRSLAPSPTGSGIEINGSNIIVRNGTISGNVTYDSSEDRFSGTGFENGVFVSSSEVNISISHLQVRNIQFRGIYCSDVESTSVRGCHVHTIGGEGIRAGVVAHSTAKTCRFTAITATTVQQSIASSLEGHGITAGRLVSDSVGSTTSSDKSSHGILSIALVRNSVGWSSGGDGITASLVVHCHGTSSGSDPSADGIEAQIAIGCITGGGANISNSYHMP